MDALLPHARDPWSPRARDPRGSGLGEGPPASPGLPHPLAGARWQTACRFTLTPKTAGRVRNPVAPPWPEMRRRFANADLVIVAMALAALLDSRIQFPGLSSPTRAGDRQHDDRGVGPRPTSPWGLLPRLAFSAGTSIRTHGAGYHPRDHRAGLRALRRGHQATPWSTRPPAAALVERDPGASLPPRHRWCVRGCSSPACELDLFDPASGRAPAARRGARPARAAWETAGAPSVAVTPWDRMRPLQGRRGRTAVPLVRSRSERNRWGRNRMRELGDPPRSRHRAASETPRRPAIPGSSGCGPASSRIRRSRRRPCQGQRGRRPAKSDEGPLAETGAKPVGCSQQAGTQVLCPICMDHDWCAHSRSPMDVMVFLAGRRACSRLHSRCRGCRRNH